jgi:hypothetical protein
MSAPGRQPGTIAANGLVVCHTSFFGSGGLPLEQSDGSHPHKGEDAQNSPQDAQNPPSRILSALGDFAAVGPRFHGLATVATRKS